MPIQIADAYRHSHFAQRQTGLLFNLPPPGPEHEQLPEGISLCMIVKNEERFLAACLDSVKGVVDEIIVVDTGSTDRTVEIARSYGADVHFREWRGDFAWARNEAIALATRRWTLCLDADEELEPESIGLLKSLRTTPAALTCVYINIVNLVCDATGDGTMSHRLIRLFPTNDVLRYTGVIHEALARTDGSEMSAVLSPITIWHKGYTLEMLNGREKDVRNKPLIKRAYEENGDDPFALFNFGNSAICSGNYDLGIEVLERMLAMDTTTRIFFPLAYLVLGQTYCETLGETEKALEKLEEGVERFPNDAGLLFTKGQVLLKLNRLEEARELFEGALDLRERMAYAVMTDEEIFEWKIYYATAGTYEREGNWERAIEYLDKALANKPKSFHLQFAKARLLERLNRYYDAELAFRRMAEGEPERGLVELVNYLLRRGRHAQAIAIVENEIDAPWSASAAAALNVAAARAVWASGQGDPIPYLDAALRLAPAHGNALLLMEQILSERGDDAGLERLHAKELLAPCTQPSDFVRRSFRLLALNRNEEARSAAEQGLERDPFNAEMRFNFAIAVLRLGDEAVAAHEFSRVDPRSADVYAEAMRHRAAVVLKHGDRAAGFAAIQQRLSVVGNDADAIVEGARMLFAAGARAEARALLEEHAEAGSPVALELARLLLQEGDIEGAGRIAVASLK